jgi:hypothetical protein
LPTHDNGGPTTTATKPHHPRPKNLLLSWALSLSLNLSLSLSGFKIFHSLNLLLSWFELHKRMGKIGTGKMRRDIENNDCVEERVKERTEERIN